MLESSSKSAFQSKALSTASTAARCRPKGTQKSKTSNKKLMFKNVSPADVDFAVACWILITSDDKLWNTVKTSVVSQVTGSVADVLV